MWPIFAQAHEENSTRNLIDTLARTPLSVVLQWVLAFTVLRIAIFYLQRNVPTHKRSGGYALGKFFSEVFDAVIYAGVFVFMIIRPFCIQAFLIPSGSMVFTLHVDDFIVANKAIYRYTDPKVGDIVVFRPPKWACTPSQLDANGEVNVDFIKRCVGAPGDVIEVKDNVLYRNGKAVEEPYKAFTEPDPPEQLEPKTFRKLSDDEVKAHERVDFKFVDFNGKIWPVDINDTIVNMNEVAAPFQVSDEATMARLKSLPPAPIPKGYYMMMGDNRFGSFDSRGWGLVPRESIIGRSEFIWFPLSRIGKTEANPGVLK